MSPRENSLSGGVIRRSVRWSASDDGITQLTNAAHRLSFFLCKGSSKGLVPCLFFLWLVSDRPSFSLLLFSETAVVIRDATSKRAVKALGFFFPTDMEDAHAVHGHLTTALADDAPTR